MRISSRLQVQDINLIDVYYVKTKMYIYIYIPILYYAKKMCNPCMIFFITYNAIMKIGASMRES